MRTPAIGCAGGHLLLASVQEECKKAKDRAKRMGIAVGKAFQQHSKHLVMCSARSSVEPDDPLPHMQDHAESEEQVDEEAVRMIHNNPTYKPWKQLLLQQQQQQQQVEPAEQQLGLKDVKEEAGHEEHEEEEEEDSGQSQDGKQLGPGLPQDVCELMLPTPPVKRGSNNRLFAQVFVLQQELQPEDPTPPPPPTAAPAAVVQRSLVMTGPSWVERLAPRPAAPRVVITAAAVERQGFRVARVAPPPLAIDLGMDTVAAAQAEEAARISRKPALPAEARGGRLRAEVSAAALVPAPAPAGMTLSPRMPPLPVEARGKAKHSAQQPPETTVMVAAAAAAAPPLQHFRKPSLPAEARGGRKASAAAAPAAAAAAEAASEALLPRMKKPALPAEARGRAAAARDGGVRASAEGTLSVRAGRDGGVRASADGALGARAASSAMFSRSCNWTEAGPAARRAAGRARPRPLGTHESAALLRAIEQLGYSPPPSLKRTAGWEQHMVLDSYEKWVAYLAGWRSALANGCAIEEQLQVAKQAAPSAQPAAARDVSDAAEV